MMKKPKHPGQILLRLFMQPCDISPSELADRLGVPLSTITNIISGRSGVSDEMACKLSREFGNKAEFWLNLQRNYDAAW